MSGAKRSDLYTGPRVAETGRIRKVIRLNKELERPSCIIQADDTGSSRSRGSKIDIVR